MTWIRLATAALLLTGAACSSADESSDAPTSVDESGGTTATESANGGSAAIAVGIDASPYNPLGALVTVDSPEAVQVQLIATSGDHVVESPLSAASDTHHELPLVGLRPDREYAVEIVSLTDGEVHARAAAAFSTGTLPDDFMDYEVTSDPDRSSPGVTFVEVQPGGGGSSYVMGLDDDGETVWYYRNTAAVGAVEPTDRGTLLSHYWPVGAREFDVLGRVTGNWQFANGREPDILDTDPSDSAPADSASAETGEGETSDDARVDVIDEDQLDRFFASLSGNPGDPEAIPVRPEWIDITSFHHEVWPMPNGNILVMATAEHELTEAQRIELCPDDDRDFRAMSDVIVEYEPDGHVVRTWDVWDVVDFDDHPGREICKDEGLFASEEVRDWTHGNSAVYDPERDAILVSLRHTNQILALDHLDEEGPQSSLRWMIGPGGTLPLDGDPPHYQHAIEVQDDGSILLYDNGNFRPGTYPGNEDGEPIYSRVVQYEIDDTADDPDLWTATQVWEYRTAEAGAPVYARFLGDADRLENGNILVTHGGIDDLDTDDDQRVLIVEVVPNDEFGGDVVWELRLGAPGPEAVSYRSERVPTLYWGPLWESEAAA